MDRYLITILLFCVVMTAGFFGDHFGYTVDGIPKGSPADVADDSEWQEADYGIDVVIAWWQEKTESNSLLGAVKYIYYFTTFSIDDVPTWLTLLFDLIILLALVLIWSMVRSE